MDTVSPRVRLSMGQTRACAMIVTLGSLCVGCLDEEARGIVWSPDGRALAWVQSGELVIHDLEGGPGARVRAPASPITDEIAWFPNGQGLVAVAEVGEARWDLVRVDLRGEVEPVVTGPERVGAPLVDPDGQLIIHAEFGPRGARVIGWIDGVRSELVEPRGDQRPLALSSDGRYLVHVCHDGLQADLWTWDLGLDVGRRLSDDPATETLARWLPRSRSVVYASQRGRRASIRLVEITDPEPKRLWRGTEVVTDLEWGSQGHEIFFCAGGRLHRVSDRGRGLRTLDGFPARIHDVAVSPDGRTLAVAGEGEPFLIDVGWTRPRPVNGDFALEVEALGGMAEALGGTRMHRAFEERLRRTASGAKRAQIHRRFGEALRRGGDHEAALEQFALALRASLPADPELHRLFGEEMFYHVGDFERARIAWQNFHAERQRLTPPGAESPRPPVALEVLLSRDPTLIRPCASLGRAVGVCRWSRAAEMFSALTALAPELREPLAGEGLALLNKMGEDLPRSAPALLNLSRTLQATGAVDPESVRRLVIRALLHERRWGEAAHAIGVAIAGDSEAFDELLGVAAEALINEALAREEADSPHGRHSSRTVPLLWGHPLISRVIETEGKPSQSIKVDALLAYAAFLDDDTERLAGFAQRVIIQGSEISEPEEPALGLELTLFAETLWAFQLLREERWSTALERFRDARATLGAIATQRPASLHQSSSLAHRVTAAILERCALLETLTTRAVAPRPLREDWRLHPLLLWQGPIDVSLPIAGTPRRPVPDFGDGPAVAALDLAADLARRERRAPLPELRDHARLGRVRALAAAGDHVTALALLHRVESEASLPALARVALWEEARIHDALGDGLLRRETLDRWLSHDPTDLEWDLYEAWQTGASRGR